VGGGRRPTGSLCGSRPPHAGAVDDRLLLPFLPFCHDLISVGPHDFLFRPKIKRGMLASLGCDYGLILSDPKCSSAIVVASCPPPHLLATPSSPPMA
jgi:hypothetical protein